MVALASAFVRLRPEVDRREFQRAGAQAGMSLSESLTKTFGPGMKTGIAQGVDQGLAEAKRRAAAQGGAAGKAWGDGFHRDANGKIRGAQGKFVADSVTGGGKAGKGFAKGFGKGSSGIVGAIKSNIGAAAGVFVPLGLAAAVGEIGKIGMAYEDNLNIFKSVSSATGAQMDQVAAKARALGADVKLPGVSAAGAASAMTELAKAGFTVQQAMDAAQGTLQLARVAGISEADAATIAANAVNAFGIDAKDTTFVVDELAAAANSSSIEITDASAAFKMAAAVFSGMQGPAVGGKEAITELNTAIAILGNNGIKGSDAGTSLKQMLLQLTGPTAQAKDQMALLAANAGAANIPLDLQNKVLHGGKSIREDALKQIYKLNPALQGQGDIAYDAAGKMRPLKDIIGLVTAGTKGMTQEERNYAITQIFGSDASRSVIALMKGGLPVYEKQRQAVLKTGAAADVAAAKNAGLRGAIDNVRSQIENAAISIYNTVKGPLTQGLNGFASALPGIFSGISKTVKFLYDNRTAILSAAYAYGVYTAAVKASAAANAIAAAGGIIPFLTKFVTAIRAATAGQIAFNFALIANPIGIAVIAIGALVAAIVIAYKRSETFRKIVQSVWAAIKVAFTATIQWFTGTLWPSLKKAWDQLAAAATWLWRNVLAPAWSGIRASVDAAWKVIKVLITAFVLEMQYIARIALWLWHNIIQPAWKGISKAIEIAWFIVKIALAAMRLYIANVLIPVIRFLYNNVVKPVFAIMGATIKAWWNGIIRPTFDNVKRAFGIVGSALSAVWRTVIQPMFNLFSGYVKNHLLPAFRAGVDLIGKTWDRVRDMARKPIAFVVNHVINPFVGGLNNAAKIVGIKDRIDTIKGFASGGQIPGSPRRRGDNRLASVTGSGNPIAVASGEFITNTRSTLANLPLVKAINAKRGKVSHADVDPYLDGGDGTGDGFGDFFHRLVNGAKGVGSIVAHPVETLKALVRDGLAAMPGAGSFGTLMKGATRHMIEKMIGSLSTGLDSAGAGVAGVIGKLGGAFGGWSGMRRLIGARFPNLHMISGFRPGARTLTGNRSYHSIGRAVDYPPVRALAQWIRSTYGARTKELITPWQDLNLWNGKPHRYHGAVWNQHNFAGGNAHVHWAAQHGGLIGPESGMPVKVFDSGGAWPSGTLGANLSGRTEYVDANRSGMSMADVVTRLDQQTEILRGLGYDIVEAQRTGTRRTARRARAGGFA